MLPSSHKSNDPPSNSTPPTTFTIHGWSPLPFRPVAQLSERLIERADEETHSDLHALQDLQIPDFSIGGCSSTYTQRPENHEEFENSIQYNDVNYLPIFPFLDKNKGSTSQKDDQSEERDFLPNGLSSKCPAPLRPRFNYRKGQCRPVHLDSSLFDDEDTGRLRKATHAMVHTEQPASFTSTHKMSSVGRMKDFYSMYCFAIYRPCLSCVSKIVAKFICLLFGSDETCLENKQYKMADEDMIVKYSPRVHFRPIDVTNVPRSVPDTKMRPGHGHLSICNMVTKQTKIVTPNSRRRKQDQSKSSTSQPPKKTDWRLSLVSAPTSIGTHPSSAFQHWNGFDAKMHHGCYDSGDNLKPMQ